MFDSITGKAKSLSRKVSNAKPEYPTKTVINLAQVDDELTTPAPVAIGSFAVVLVLVILFAKFGVVDMLGAASSANNEVSSLQGQVTQLQQANASYDALKEELDKYAVPGATEEESSFASREQALEVAQAVSGLGGQLESISLSGNTLQIQLGDTTLSTVTDVVAKIKKNKWVQSAQPNTAGNSEDSKKVTATITVELVPSAVEAGASGDSGTASDASEEGEE